MRDTIVRFRFVFSDSRTKNDQPHALANQIAQGTMLARMNVTGRKNAEGSLNSRRCYSVFEAELK
jgi:hypothetical protein